MKADKRAKIEIRMENLEKELEHIKADRDGWYERYENMVSQNMRLETEARNNGDYIVDLERKVHSLECTLKKYQSTYGILEKEIDGNV